MMTDEQDSWTDTAYNRGDHMDYDGMGNHGRFPPQYPTAHKKSNRWLNILLLTCIVTGLILIVAIT